MHSPSLLDDLVARGLIAQSTPLPQLQQLLAKPQQQPVRLYCGFDPTAGSLHIGHLVPLLLLRRFQQAGHQVIALIGGATGLIGDPSFKASERGLQSAAQVAAWTEQLQQQIRHLLPPQGAGSVLILNNADWLSQMTVPQLLRDVGKHFSVNALLQRDSVRQRLQRPEQGLSFTEFSYVLLQAYDFAMLNRHYACQLQIGGQDQWGNIVSGIDLTRRLNQQQVHGLTLPLITKADGTKFGKTETGTIWLDPALTSPYRFYQFWLNVSDVEVYPLLRFYSSMSIEAIAALERSDGQRQGKPQAQQLLAAELTALVHGQSGLAAAQRISLALFQTKTDQLSRSDFAQLQQDGMPAQQVDARLELQQLLLQSGLVSSKQQLRQLLQAGALQLNDRAIQPAQLTQPLAAQPALQQQYWLLRKGKKTTLLWYGAASGDGDDLSC